MKYRFFSLCLLFSLASNAFAENKNASKLAYSGFSGGMMLHTGFVQSRDFAFYNSNGTVRETAKLQGAPFGIGGAIRLHFGEHLRVGSEGYVSTLTYGKNHSYSSVGWGGLLADCAWHINSWTPFVGGTIGGGSVKNLTLLEPTPDDFKLENNSTSYRKYTFMALTPFVGVEYAMTEKVHLVLKVDYLLNLTNWQDDFATGPRVYFGFMFCH